MAAFNEDTPYEFLNEKREQVVPIVYYTDTERIVIGTAYIKGGKIRYEINTGLPEEVMKLLRDKPLSYSAADVLHHDTPLFPANAYEVNEPLASARLLDAVLNIPKLKITEERETHD